ncbi:hypothetical protein RhiirA5_420550 [Rhizophagus irregularis]|uniref:Uncharacterized protein n=4 Tax=Rhizophagus irregularis TaxID=588596 RepID=A0A2I1ETM5_9GLOM|nr:hypothetical protein RirG_258610 [Rhizophagus irregularis DAOM 197198w]PKC05710.1 hypothetical protein RhiirA5_420550 [Rhizophagus irregularis]GBC20857.2 hypothetical protein GLOIN_2v1776522 [Rhizophagus irregularis DAOM 181602=DAOM 197198]PKC61368.1 hypothetical protein RhiirA1_466640 [Rhizophagus irregularis]PKY25479.1 hypothetical protein RhiirB3_440437 [Rhizophagus irregularis]
MLKKYDEHFDFMKKFDQRRQMSNHIRQTQLTHSIQPPCFSEVDISSAASYDSAQTHLSNMSWKTSVPPQLTDSPAEMVTSSVPSSRNIPLIVDDSSILENSTSSPKPELTLSPQGSKEPISTPKQIPITVFDFSELDTLSTSTKPTLFPSPQSFNEASSSSDGYITADSNDLDSTENIISPPAVIPMVTLDLFNSTPYPPVYTTDGFQKPYGF